jgi:hypothetical protein
MQYDLTVYTGGPVHIGQLDFMHAAISALNTNEIVDTGRDSRNNTLCSAVSAVCVLLT